MKTTGYYYTYLQIKTENWENPKKVRDRFETKKQMPHNFTSELACEVVLGM